MPFGGPGAVERSKPVNRGDPEAEVHQQRMVTARVHVMAHPQRSGCDFSVPVLRESSSLRVWRRTHGDPLD